MKKRDAIPPAAAPEPWFARPRVISLALAVVTVAVFWSVWDFQFLNYDDGDYVAENRAVQQGISVRSLAWAFTTGHAANWHPVTWVSHMADCSLFGAWAMLLCASA